jgi:hypothetical protein
MSLTDAQYTTLANHIRANTDPDVVAALAIRNDTELARIYNLDSATDVWKPEVTPEEYRANMVWTEVDQLTAGASRIWEWITSNMTLPFDASDVNVRQGLTDVFGQNTTTRTQLLAVSKRFASVYEGIFATGTGTKNLEVVGPVTIKIIGKALNSNP